MTSTILAKHLEFVPGDYDLTLRIDSILLP